MKHVLILVLGLLPLMAVAQLDVSSVTTDGTRLVAVDTNLLVDGAALVWSEAGQAFVSELFSQDAVEVLYSGNLVATNWTGEYHEVMVTNAAYSVFFLDMTNDCFIDFDMAYFPSNISHRVYIQIRRNDFSVWWSEEGNVTGRTVTVEGSYSIAAEGISSVELIKSFSDNVFKARE